MMTQEAPSFVRRRILPFLVLFLCAGFILFSWFWVRRSWNLQLEPQFERGTRQIESGISQRLDFYLNLLYGVKGFFAANPSPDQMQWDAYLDKQNIRQRYPALADVRFIAKTPEGFTAKFIHSGSSRSGKLEFQLGADPFNQLAFEKAQDMAQVILTNKIDFTEGGRKQAGFLIIFPLYQNESPAGSIQARRQALLGFAVAVIRANDVFRSVAPGSHAIDYEIYDARELTQEHLLYNDDRILAAQGRTLIADNDEALTARSEKSFSKDGALKVPGHMWTIHFSTRPKFFFNESRDQFLKLYLLSGMLLSLVVFGIAFFLNETCNASSVL